MHSACAAAKCNWCEQRKHYTPFGSVCSTPASGGFAHCGRLRNPHQRMSRRVPLVTENELACLAIAHVDDQGALQVARQHFVYLIDDDEDLGVFGRAEFDALEFFELDRDLVVDDEQPGVADYKGQVWSSNCLEPVESASLTGLDERIFILLGEPENALIKDDQTFWIDVQLPKTRRMDQHRESPFHLILADTDERVAIKH